eukprot:1149589-Pelagomonas_calceolata.AAC.1
MAMKFASKFNGTLMVKSQLFKLVNLEGIGIHSCTCLQGQLREGKGYIAVPACGGSLAEAKRACNPTKPNLCKCQLKALS